MRETNGLKTGTEMLLWSVSEVVKTQHPRRSNHSHKKVSIYLIVLLLRLFFLLFSFFLPLTFLSSVTVQGVGFQSWGQSDTTLAPDLTACFHESIKSKLKGNKSQQSSNHRNSHLHSRLSMLPCNANGWLLFTLITWSRCVFIWSIPAAFLRTSSRLSSAWHTSSTTKQAM